MDNDGQYDDATGTTATFNSATSGQYTVGVLVTDDDGATNSATAMIDVSEAGANALYVYDIRFESKRGNKDWRAVFEIHTDSGDLAAGVMIEVTFAGTTYTGTTDSDGVFRTSWIKDLSSGDHYANAVDLVLAGYSWDPLSTLHLEDDSDGDGKPDDLLSL